MNSYIPIERLLTRLRKAGLPEKSVCFWVNSRLLLVLLGRAGLAGQRPLFGVKPQTRLCGRV